jgi:DNA-binding NtrC family response regulator
MAEPVGVLLVDDDDAFRTVIAGELRARGFAMTTAATAAEALARAAADRPRVVLLDLRLPDGDGLDVLRALLERQIGAEVIILTGHGTIDTAIGAIRLGAFDYVAKPCPIAELELRIQKALERRSLVERNLVLEGAFTPAGGGDEVCGRSERFLETLRLLERVAPTSATVLILGETGSGKEVMARRIHALSTRAARPFVTVECAALQEDLLQSEIFGHERGAYTGAVRAKAGLFEVANGGTVFLDEIGEVNLATQVKLLRALETSTFRHVGGTEEIRVDVRVIAATNRDLGKLVAEGRFRDDLLYRLDTFRLEVPPLRERRADIVPLFDHFAARLDRAPGGHTLSPEARAALERHDWPGNVRELRHAVEHALIVCEGPTIELQHLPRALRAATQPADPDLEPELPTLVELERQHIARALKLFGGHRARVAHALGISERNLYRKLKEHGLG